jgi:hypothetical protein
MRAASPPRRARWGPVLGGALLLVAIAATAHAAHADPAPDPTVPPTVTAPPTTVPTGPTTVPTKTSGPTTTTTRPPVSVPPGGFGGPPKPKPGAKPEAPIPDPSPQVRILLDQVRLQDQQRIVAARQRQLAVQQFTEAAARHRVDLERAAVRRAQRSVARAEARIRSDALAAYVDPGSTGLEQLVGSGYGQDKPRAVLLSVAIQHEKKVLAAAQDGVRTRQATVARLLSEAAASARRTAAARSMVDKAQADATARSDELGVALGGDPTWSLSIEGVSVFTPAEITAWFDQHGVRSRASAPVSDLAYSYVKEGRDEGVRGDMAFAQSVLETGSFTNLDTIHLNNFAGIGHCDTCASGFAFATAALGVRAQIQLLKGYADAHATYKHPLVDGRLHGPAGCCQTWRQLTHTWATNPNYGAKLMVMYRQMLYWLVVHRGITPDVGAT